MCSENQSQNKQVKFICECREVRYDDHQHNHHDCNREKESKCRCKKCCYRQSNSCR